ncbi:SAV_6107 family HEPN domain-containing protein [Corynebacterium auriscanis]|uniref:SAV_6107 family HEPN domain-containing protein n=1 Tax=Corynebacterium auriscanis TaxID=99807 RepID=UPI0022463956|nr:SAV_6107 family HEPN domain-containing protein [Corynebacterium auriscanis]MCX2163148.1 hypothetical protein [Corynebacterium auriscanis]
MTKEDIMASQNFKGSNVTRISGRKIVSARSFIDDAEKQLERSRFSGRVDDRVVFAYRAALRAAGALVQTAMVGRKRSPRGSAWEKLRVLHPDLKDWVKLFEGYARLASRAGMGLESGMDPQLADQLYADAARFIDLAREETGYLPSVA